MKSFCFFTLFLIITSLIDEEDFFKAKFTEFRKTYKKVYENQEEEERRFNIFKFNFENYGKFNEFSDLFDRIQAKEYFDRTKSLPDSVSYAYIWDKVKEQKACGNCYEFAFVSQIEAQFEIKFNKNYIFSEQEMLDCSEGIVNCKGGNNIKMINFLKERKYLILNEAYESYDGIINNERCKNKVNDDFKYKNSVKFKVEKVDFNNDNYENRINCMKKYLITKGPMGASIITTDDFHNFKDPDCDKIFQKIPKKCNINFNFWYMLNPISEEPDHSFTIVGYKDYKNKITNQIETFWIIRNSWGPNWGHDGYGKIKAGDNICGIEWFNEYLEINWDSWCGEGCYDCSYSQKNFYCASCLEGYELVNKQFDNYYGECIKCPDNCKSCITNTQKIQTCTECFHGYWWDSKTNKCKECFKGCQKCNGPYQKDCIINNDNLKLSDGDETKDYCSICKNDSIYLIKSFCLIFLYCLLF